MSSVNFLATKVYEDISKAISDGYNLIVEEGSSRSSKTWSNFQVLFIEMYRTPNVRIKVFRDTKASCYSIVEDDFIKWASDPMLRKKQYEEGLITIEEMDSFLRDENLTRYFERNKTNHVWTMIGSGSTLKFTGLDDEDEAMGMTQDIAWLNEPYGFSKEVFLQLKQRTSRFILFDWNPKSDHFINKFKKDKDCITLYSTFEDNPYCPLNMKKQIWSYQPMEQFSAVLDGRISEVDAFKYDIIKNELGFSKKEVAELQRCLVNEMNDTKSLYHWMVFGRGLASESPNKIYQGWEGITREKYDEVKRSLNTTPMYGLDFGFRNPSACVEVLYDGDCSFFIRSLIYKPILSMVSGLGDEMVRNGVPVGDVTYIFADSQDRDISNNVRMINELRLTHRLNVIPVNKPSYKERFDFINKMRMYYVINEGDEIKNEYDGYEWEFINGVPTEKPVKKNDHCFVGNTMVATINGDVKIKDIKVGDLVLTRSGYKRVLLKHENGVKKVSEYSMQLNTIFVSLCCTDDHLICTSKEWKQFTKLSKGDKLYLPKFLTVKNTDSTKEKGILAEVIKGFIGKFGNIIKEIYQTVMTYTTLMVIHLIIKLKTLIWSKGNYTQGFQVKKDLSITLNLQKNFREKAQKRQKVGILRMKVLNFIEKSLNYLIQKEFQRQDNVRFAEKVMKQKQSDLQNIAIQTATLKQFDFVRNYEDNVYDLTVEDDHEYFANGILVSNCMNSIEYGVWGSKEYYGINI